MRWLPVLLLAYVAVGLQAGVAGELTVGGVGPNIGLLAVVFIGIYAPREPALLACVIIGGMQDLATQQAPGLFAVSYGIVGWLIVAVQQVVYREHPLTHIVLTLIGGIVTAMLLYLHGRLMAPRVSLKLVLGMAVYSAVLAPFFIAVLQRLRPLFGFESHRRRMGY